MTPSRAHVPLSHIFFGKVGGKMGPQLGPMAGFSLNYHDSVIGTCRINWKLVKCSRYQFDNKSCRYMITEQETKDHASVSGFMNNFTAHAQSWRFMYCFGYCCPR